VFCYVPPRTSAVWPAISWTPPPLANFLPEFLVADFDPPTSVFFSFPSNLTHYQVCAFFFSYELGSRIVRRGHLASPGPSLTSVSSPPTPFYQALLHSLRSYTNSTSLSVAYSFFPSPARSLLFFLFWKPQFCTCDLGNPNQPTPGKPSKDRDPYSPPLSAFPHFSHRPPLSPSVRAFFPW